MKIYRRLFIFILFICLFIIVAGNIFILKKSDTQSGYYKVEAKRISDEIRNGTAIDEIDLKKYPTILGIYKESTNNADILDDTDNYKNTDDSIFESNNHYVISNINCTLYRIEYKNASNIKLIFTFNIILIVLMMVIIALLIYIGRFIIKPFDRINTLPRELAKGNLAVDIPEEKNRYLGEFTWGINMLKESIEEGKKKDISLQKDQKLLLLSLSHDVKTPLSAIKLNAKAIEKGLYDDKERQLEALKSITKRANEIEDFINQIMTASSEDFMNFDVKMSEQFLSKILLKVSEKYANRLAITGTDFNINKYSDCLLSCDEGRLLECISNLMENAIKYGDGVRIELSFEKVDDCILIHVLNTGCTLDKNELNKIFESFNRGSNSSNIKGNGLGLFICRKIMRLMSGDVYANIKDDCFIGTLVVRLA